MGRRFTSTVAAILLSRTTTKSTCDDWQGGRVRDASFEAGLGRNHDARRCYVAAGLHRRGVSMRTAVLSGRLALRSSSHLVGADIERRSDESELVGGPELVAEEGGGVDDVVARLEPSLGGVTARGCDLDAAGDALVGRLEVNAEGLFDGDDRLARGSAGRDDAARGSRGGDSLGPDARAGEGGAADRGEGGGDGGKGGHCYRRRIGVRWKCADCRGTRRARLSTQLWIGSCPRHPEPWLFPLTYSNHDRTVIARSHRL